MALDPLQPYGALVETTVRVATWNVWSDFGPWQDRYRRIESVLVDCEPDLVAAQECWRTDDHDVLGDVAARMSFHYDAALDWYESYAARGDDFAHEVHLLAEAAKEGT